MMLLHELLKSFEFLNLRTGPSLYFLLNQYGIPNFEVKIGFLAFLLKIELHWIQKNHFYKQSKLNLRH